MNVAVQTTRDKRGNRNFPSFLCNTLCDHKKICDGPSSSFARTELADYLFADLRPIIRCDQSRQESDCLRRFS